MPVLLLVGAGHAHLYVVKRAAELAAAGYRIHLLAPRFFDYSGVASATAAGALPRDAGRIDVRALVGDSGVEFHEDALASLDQEARIAVTSTGAHLSYDVLSLNIGSVAATAGMQVHPTVLKVKPLSGLADLDRRLGASHRQGATVTVVGGGASGAELAAHLAVRRDVVQVSLVEAGPVIGADLPARARTRIERLLARRGVAVRTGCEVREIGERRLVCDDDTEMTHDVALLATGLTAPPLLTELGLGDDSGVPVRATLQHVDRDEIYAVGDCALFPPGCAAPHRSARGAAGARAAPQPARAAWRGSRCRCTNPSDTRCRSSISATASGWPSADAGGGTARGRCASSGSSIDVG